MSKKKARKKTPSRLKGRVPIEPTHADYQRGRRIGKLLRDAQAIGARIQTLELSGGPKNQNDRLQLAAGLGETLRRVMVDRQSFSVTYAGKTGDLGDTDGFRILACLAENPGRPISHKCLQDALRQPVAELKSKMRDTRDQLRQAGLTELADAIKGRKGYYCLDI